MIYSCDLFVGLETALQPGERPVLGSYLSRSGPFRRCSTHPEAVLQRLTQIAGESGRISADGATGAAFRGESRKLFYEFNLDHELP